MQFFAFYEKFIYLFVVIQVAKREAVGKVVEKSFRKSKSAGFKKIHQRIIDGYIGLSKRQVLNSVKTNEKLWKFNVKFINKAKPKPVTVKSIHEQHQVDLVDMKNMKILYKGVCYHYVFSLIDIFLRFHWLAPLSEKKKQSHEERAAKDPQRTWPAGAFAK